MKKSILILLCLILAGCCSHRYEYFTSPYILPLDEIQADPYIKSTASGYGIPVVAWKETRGAPYDLELAFISKKLPEAPIVLTEVIIIDTNGEEHQLLHEKKQISNFNKRWFGGSHASLGTYRGDVYESKSSFKNIPLKFAKGKSCMIKAQFILNSEEVFKEWKLGCDLRKKTQNTISYLRGY